MIRSVISIPAPNSKKQVADGNTKAFSTEASSSDTAKEKCALKAADSKKSKPGSLDPAAPGLLNVAQKNEDVKKSAFVGKQATQDKQASTNRHTVEVTSINGTSKMKWPAETVKKTIQEPTIAYSCNPSLCDPGIAFSVEEEKLRSDLFIICDLLDEMVDFISLKDHRKRKHHHSASRASENHKKRRAKEGSVTGLNLAESNNAEGDLATQKAETSKKRKKSKKHRKKRSEQKVNLFSPSVVENRSNIEKDASIIVPISSNEVAEKISSPSDIKGAQNKMTKKSKKSTKKKMAVVDGALTSQEAIATQSPSKKQKLVKAEDSKLATEASQQRIKIAFTQSSSKPAIPTSQKSKWDTSSDEEGSTRKGAISYKFSDESDAEKKSESPQRLPEPKDPKMMPFGKMQPGGLLKTIELHNPLPDIKSSGPSAENVEARSRSRSYSESRSRSRSSSYSYSSDDSYDHHRRKRRSRRRSYSRSYSRSRSHSYSSYSRSRSRSYSRSYSRSSSRSRYRSSSRSSYSSYSSYSSRSPSSSHRYTRAILPKYGTRAFKIGKRKKFKKNKQLKGSQQPNYNAAIMKQLETGRAKAEETVMRLKKQKEEQEQLQSRAMASIAAAASSAGITLPTTTSTTTSTAKSFVSPTGTVPSGTVSIPSTSVQNGDLLDSFTQASQLAKVPVFLPRKVKPEFIGPMRPGVDTDCEIPLPSGTPNILNPIEGASPTYIQEDPQPMQAPDTEDPIYKTLQEQVAKHMMSGNSVSPGTEHLHQQLAAQYLPMQMAEGQIIIDPLTGQPLHVPAAMHAHAAQLQQQHFAAMVAAQHSSTPQVEMQEQEDKPAPHEAVVRSYADQVIMSNHKALVSQTQPVFTLAPLAQNIPQAGVPLQASPFMVNAMQMQLQAQQLQQAQLQAMQAAQLQNLQLQAALGLMHPHLGLVQPGLPILAQQQLMPASPQLIQLPNGQIVQLGQTPNIFLHRFTRPM